MSRSQSKSTDMCPYCNHPTDAHKPVCLVFTGDGEACECDGKESTPEKLTPEQRLQVAINDALADAFRRGKQEGRAEVLRYLTLIVTAEDEASRAYAIEQARAELAKWVV